MKNEKLESSTNITMMYSCLVCMGNFAKYETSSVPRAHWNDKVHEKWKIKTMCMNIYNKCVCQSVWECTWKIYPNRKSIIIFIQFHSMFAFSHMFVTRFFCVCARNSLNKSSSHRSLQSLFMAKYITANKAFSFSACLSKRIRATLTRIHWSTAPGVHTYIKFLFGYTNWIDFPVKLWMK